MSEEKRSSRHNDDDIVDARANVGDMQTEMLSKGCYPPPCREKVNEMIMSGTGPKHARTSA